MKNDIGTLGRVPWFAGGDWNRTPMQGEALWAGIGTLMVKECPTQQGGRELDWFVVAPAPGEVCCTGMMEGPCPDHIPVHLGVPRWGQVGLGLRVCKPRSIEVLGHDHKTGEDVEVAVSWSQGCPGWEQWSREAEAWLGETYGCTTRSYKGRGGIFSPPLKDGFNATRRGRNWVFSEFPTRHSVDQTNTKGLVIGWQDKKWG